MLAEHDRCGPALAATTATFPLNDVDFREPARSLMDLHEQQNLVVPDIPMRSTRRHRAHEGLRLETTGGASRDRTDDLMLAKQPLSQLSYGPNPGRCGGRRCTIEATASQGRKAARAHARQPRRRTSPPALEATQRWWAWDDSNVRPHPYQGCALTT